MNIYVKAENVPAPQELMERLTSDPFPTFYPSQPTPARATGSEGSKQKLKISRRIFTVGEDAEVLRSKGEWEKSGLNNRTRTQVKERYKILESLPPAHQNMILLSCKERPDDIAVLEQNEEGKYIVKRIKKKGERGDRKGNAEDDSSDDDSNSEDKLTKRPSLNENSNTPLKKVSKKGKQPEQNARLPATSGNKKSNDESSRKGQKKPLYEILCGKLGEDIEIKDIPEWNAGLEDNLLRALVNPLAKERYYPGILQALRNSPEKLDALCIHLLKNIIKNHLE